MFTGINGRGLSVGMLLIATVLSAYPLGCENAGERQARVTLPRVNGTPVEFVGEEATIVVLHAMVSNGVVT